MIYIVKHKLYENPIPQGYEELYVGKMFKKNGEHINELNPYINEVTGMYWIWKNCPNDDVVGLAHYRRFFIHPTKSGLLTLNEAEQILQKKKIILPPDFKTGKTIYQQMRGDFDDDGTLKVLEKYKQKICKLEPDLVNYFDNTVIPLIPRNMFIMKHEDFDDYCKWLMPLIIPLTQEFVKKDLWLTGNKRVIGYLAERLFGYWVHKKNYHKLSCRCNIFNV